MAQSLLTPSNINQDEPNGLLRIEQIYKGMVAVNYGHDSYFIKVKADVPYYHNRVWHISLMVLRDQTRLFRQDNGIVLGST